jgi:hypothetical protein
MTVAGYPRRVWQGPDGEELIESYTITGMSHGAALDPGAEPHQCGTAAPFFNAVGISSTHRIADFWGLLAGRPASARTRLRQRLKRLPVARPRRRRNRRSATRGREMLLCHVRSPAMARVRRTSRRPMIGAGPPADRSVSMCTASFRLRWRRQVCSRATGRAARPATRRWASTFLESFRRRSRRLACSKGSLRGRPPQRSHRSAEDLGLGRRRLGTAARRSARLSRWLDALWAGVVG